MGPILDYMPTIHLRNSLCAAPGPEETGNDWPEDGFSPSWLQEHFLGAGMGAGPTPFKLF
ncbi:MAG: hypothetical protein OXJ55_21355 [Caldilineaceae bacterium]|nr:hypothetical protein [Caldilineaceae bacterium]MDE0462461.1 hypothetical protein [Caldilineaceae bacterium]